MAYWNEYTESQLNDSFDYIENFIKQNVSSWESAPNTSEIESLFSSSIQEMQNVDFALLLLHTGYIPEMYAPDSSQETLYSKLIESLVCEWAKRIGFSDSYLQTQKSNKEDVTLVLGNKHIVCDAKSFRLGRSQAAPNVKDTIKKQAYITWLSEYSDKEQIGGLVTFPSLHDWKKGSEAYQYFTEGNPAIMMLFYEHMAFMLLNGIGAERIIAILKSYNTLFPTASKDRIYYWNKIIQSLFENRESQFKEFQKESSEIINKKVNHAISILAGYLSETRAAIASDVEQMSVKDVRELAIAAEYQNQCSDIERQKDNIIKFRLNDK